MFRQVSPTRESLVKKSATMIRAALGRLRLPKSGRQSEMAQRRHDAFTLHDTAAKLPMAQPHHIDECIAADKKSRRGILDPAINDGRRVAGPADAVGGNYHIIYDDELDDDEFAGDAKDFQDECDAIADAGPRDASPDYFPMPPEIPHPLRPSPRRRRGAPPPLGEEAISFRCGYFYRRPRSTSGLRSRM